MFAATSDGMGRRFPTLFAFVLLLALGIALAGPAEAGDPESEAERESRLARRGAGLRGGAWDVDLASPDGVDESHWPMVEAFFQKGLDQHLAWVNNLSFWSRKQKSTTSGGLGGGTETEEVTSFIVPLFTAVKFHPFTTVDDRFEPFLDGGAGFALGILDVSREGSGGLLSSSGEGTSFTTGFGFRLGAGLDFRLSEMFGLSAQGRYQWVKFSEAMGDARTFEGFGVDLGLTYRFQY